MAKTSKRGRVPKRINLIGSWVPEFLIQRFHGLVMLGLQRLLALVEMPLLKGSEGMMESLVDQNRKFFSWRSQRKWPQGGVEVVLFPPLRKGSVKSFGAPDC